MKISEFNKLTKEERKQIPFKQLPWPNRYIPIIFVIVIVLGIGTCVKDSIDHPMPGENSIDTLALQLNAKSIAETAVKSLLKAPTSAEFPSDQQNYWMLPDSTLVIKGAVDSQNTFGAMLRTTFYVKLKWKSDYKEPGIWQVLTSYLDE